MNMTMDPGDKHDGKVNKECLSYDLGKFPLKPGSHDGSWSRETHVLSQARMAAYTSDSLTGFALQCGFHWAWLHALHLKKDMSLVSDVMNQPVSTIYAQEVKDAEGNFHWTTTKTCAWCNKAFSNGESAMNHMHTHYQIVLVCPFCGMWGSHSYSSMREHVKKCKETYRDLLKGSDAETGLYEPCFCKGDTHLPKKGLFPPAPFTYKLEEGRVNTKSIEQLVSEFHTRVEEDVTAARNAHSLRKRQNVQAPNDDLKKSSSVAETDTKETPKKKRMKSTPSTAKPPPSAAMGRVPKGTGIDEIKGLDDDELDYNDNVESEDADSDPVQAPEPPQDEKPRDSGKPSDEPCHPSGDDSARHPGDSHSDCKKSRG